MTMPGSRPLRVFLCHSSGDKPIVRELYQKLTSEGWLDIWLDEERLYPGQDWNYEIERAVETTDVIIVCLSNNSVSKEGYIQRELRFALDIALEKPEGTIFVIPLRLDNCEPPRRLRGWQFADYFPENMRARGYQRLLESLKLRAGRLDPSIYQPEETSRLKQTEPIQPSPQVTEPIKPSPSVKPKRQISFAQIGSAIQSKPLWFYGRLMVIILLISGFFGPWYQPRVSDEQDVAFGYDIYSSSLTAFNTLVIPILVPLGFGAVFLVTLLRLFPWKFIAAPALVRLERLITGIAPTSVLFGMYLYILLSFFSDLIWLWGFWLSVLGIFLAPINILLEMASTLQKGRRWPRWAWLLAFSINLPWLLLLSFWVRFSDITGNS